MKERKKRKAQRSGYSPGHPWYYVLGGKPLYPRQIMEASERDGCWGYLAADIDRADRLAEPKRSHALRKMREEVFVRYRADLARYREVVFCLNRTRREAQGSEPRCEDVHVSVSLKHNHLLGDLAHLRILAELLDRQRDLFDF